jgi:serralysin
VGHRHLLRRWATVILFTASAAVATPNAAEAAPGDLDTTFGGDGKVTTDFTSQTDWAVATVIQPDDKVVAVGIAGYGGSNPKFALARYNTNGSLDTTFGGGDGKVLTDFTPRLDSAWAVVVQPDSKILTVGTAGGGLVGVNSKMALARYNANGTLDPAFGGGDGRVVTDFTRNRDYASTPILLMDGRVVVTGSAGIDGPDPKFALARYNANGSLDTTFGGGDGKVVTDFTNGSDQSYGGALQADGKILAVGDANFGNRSTQKLALARYNANGTLDTTFSGDGRVVTTFTAGGASGDDVVVQPDQRIVVSGNASYWKTNGRFALARYDTDGSLDATFGGDGKVVTDISSRWDYAHAVALQLDGKMIAAGEAGWTPTNRDIKFALARYNVDGSLDSSFGGDGKVTANFTKWEDFASDVDIQSDGGIVAAGLANSRFALVRYLAA